MGRATMKHQEAVQKVDHKKVAEFILRLSRAKALGHCEPYREI